MVDQSTDDLSLTCRNHCARSRPEPHLLRQVVNKLDMSTGARAVY